MDSTKVHSSSDIAVAFIWFILILTTIIRFSSTIVYDIWSHCYGPTGHSPPSRQDNFGDSNRMEGNGSAPVYSAAISAPSISNKSSLPPSIIIPPATQQSSPQANLHPQLHQQSLNHHPHQPAQPNSTALSNTQKLQLIIPAVIKIINHHIRATEILLPPRIESLPDNQLRSECPEASPNIRYETKNSNMLPNNHSTPPAHPSLTQAINHPSHTTYQLTSSLILHILHLTDLLKALPPRNQEDSHPPPSPITSPDITTPFPHAQPPVNSTPVNTPTLSTIVDPPTSPSHRYSRNQLLRLTQRNSANLTPSSKPISLLIPLISAVPLPPKLTKQNITPSPSTPTPPNHHQQYPPHRPPHVHFHNNNHLPHQLATLQLQQAVIYHQQLLHITFIQAHQQLQQLQQIHQNIHFLSPTNSTTPPHHQQHPTPHHSQQSYFHSNPHYSPPHKPPDAPILSMHHNSYHRPYFSYPPPNIPTTTSLPFPGRPQNSIPYKKPYPISHNSPQRCQPSLRQPQFLWRKKSPSLPEAITLGTT